MLRPFAKNFSLVLIISLLPAIAAWAQVAEPNPLDAFPDRTAIVLRFASVDKLSGGFNEMVGALGPVAAMAGPGFEAGLAEMLEIQPDMSVVDRSAPVHFAIFPLMEARPPIAWLVRAPDEAKLKRTIMRAGPDEVLTSEKRSDGFEKITKENRTFYFTRWPKGSADSPYVLFAQDEAVVGQLAFDSAKQPTFASVVEPRAAKLLAEGQGAAVVNVALLTEVFASHIQQGHEAIKRQIESIPDEALAMSGQDPKAVKQIYIGLADIGFDILADAKFAAGRVNFSGTGTSAAGLLGLKEGSATDQYLAASPPATLDTLGLLPAGAAAYFGLTWNQEQLGSWMRDYMSVAGIQQSPEKAAAVASAFAQMGEAGGGPAVVSVDFPLGGMVSAVLQPAEHPEKLIAGNRAYQASIGEIKTGIYSQKFEYQEGVETYRDRPVDLLRQRITFGGEANPGLAIAQQFMQKLFGGETIDTRITSVEGMFVQATASDPKHIRQLVDSLQSGEGVVGLEESFSAVRDQLAEEVNLIVLVNVPEIIVEFVRMVRDVPPFNMILGQLPFNFGVQPAVSYGAVSLGTEPQGLRLHVVVPVGQPKGVMQIFGQ